MRIVRPRLRNICTLTGCAALLAAVAGQLHAQNSTATIRPVQTQQPAFSVELTEVPKDFGPQILQATYAQQDEASAPRSIAQPRSQNSQASPSDRVEEQPESTRRSPAEREADRKADRKATDKEEADKTKADKAKSDREKAAKEKAEARRKELRERIRKDRDRSATKSKKPKPPKFNATDKIRGDFRPISELNVDIRESAEKKPEDRAVVFVGEYPLGDSQKMWGDRTLLWEPGNLAYNPLYFQETQLERYGQHAGPFAQAFFSSAHFMNCFIALPINVLRNSPNACVYPVNYPNPGECVPFKYDLPHIFE